MKRKNKKILPEEKWGGRNASLFYAVNGCSFFMHNNSSSENSCLGFLNKCFDSANWRDENIKIGRGLMNYYSGRMNGDLIGLTCIKSRAHDEAMAEVYRKDPDSARQVISGCKLSN